MMESGYIVRMNMISKIIDDVHSHNIKIVSCDIFDTLIFRHVKNPSAVFAKSYMKSSRQMPEYVASEDWKNLRIYMEKQARKNHFQRYNNYEVTLNEIYSYLPDFFGDRHSLMENEIVSEIENCFVNEEIYNTLSELRKRGYVIVLISDMYLSKSAIERILSSCDVNLELFDAIYLSNEYQQSKRYGGLFKELINKYNIQPNELYHIGDNTESDIASARRLGIITYFYSLISESRFEYPELYIESFAPYKCDENMQTLRIISAGESEEYWHKLGALILGPFFAAFAQWIVMVSNRRGIHRIRPIMREGDFLSKLINAAVSENHLNIDVKPLYASRMATFSANFNVIGEKEIEYLFSTYNICVKDVFDLLNIKEKLYLFDEMKDYQSNQLMAVSVEGDSAYNKILNWLTDEETIKYIREKNSNSSQVAMTYFKGIGLDELSITIDVGWRGSIQKAINKLYESSGEKSVPSHYLCVAKPDVADNLFPNTDIRGFLGNFGSYEDVTRTVFPRIIELALLSTKGTTLGYKQEDGRVLPIIQEINYPEWQVKAAKLIQNGILAFQKNYYKYASKEMKEEKWLRENAIYFYGIIDRLLKYPLINEASHIKKLQYDQNFGGRGFSEIISDSDIIIADGIGLDRYYRETYENKVMWKSGLSVLLDPIFHLKSLCVIRCGYKTYSWLQLIQEVITEAEKLHKKIILVGAGNNLKQFISIFSTVNRRDLIKEIWDNSDEKQGAIYCEKEVNRPGVNEEKIYLCTVENIGAEKALCKQIKSLAGEDILFYGLGYRYNGFDK